MSLSTPGVQNSAPTIQAFRESLRAQGYVEGQNIRIEYRFSEGNEERLVDVVNELARIPVAAIVAVGTPWAVAAKRADVRVPVVMVAVGDPVGAGLVESLARPGGHLTGPGSGGPALVAKKLELLKELVPDAGTLRVAVFANLSNPSKTHQLQAAQASARRLGVELLPVDVRTPEGIPSAFERALAAGARCVLVLSDALMVRNRTQITQLARQVRIPTMYEGADYAEAGGLMSYGQSRYEMFRRAAVYVAKLLRGARPADLPVEAPSQFELVLNMNAAEDLGLTFSQSFLLQADRIIR